MKEHLSDVKDKSVQLGSDAKSHVEENKEFYTKAAIGTGLVLGGLTGYALLKKFGYNKNYGSKKTKIIAKALQQVPLSLIEEIIEVAESRTNLSVRQLRGLQMSVNYARHVRDSADISGVANASIRQGILSFKSSLERTGEHQSLDLDDGEAEREAQQCLREMEFNSDIVSEEEFDDYFDEVPSSLGANVSSQSIPLVEVESMKEVSLPLEDSPKINKYNQLVLSDSVAFKIIPAHLKILTANTAPKFLITYKEIVIAGLKSVGKDVDCRMISSTETKIITEYVVRKLPSWFTANESVSQAKCSTKYDTHHCSAPQMGMQDCWL